MSYRIAQAREADTIAETLVKRYAKAIVCWMKRVRKKIDRIPVSNNTVQRRIQEITDIIEELISRLHSCDAFSLQIDGSTDVEGLSIWYVRYKFSAAVEEDLLLCKSLESRATGEEIFNVLITTSRIISLGINVQIYAPRVLRS